MTVAASDLPLAEAARILRGAIKNKAYQSTRLGSAVARYLAWKMHSGAPRTVEVYESYLARLCMFLLAEGDPDVFQVTPDMLLRAADQHPLGSYGVVRSAYRDFFGWAEDWMELPRNPALKLPRKRKQNMRVYDIFSVAEQAQIIKATERMPLPWIQRLRVLCLIDLGIRKDEARKLQPLNFDTTARVVVVHGKGDKERVIPFGDEVFRAFVQYANRPIPKVKMRDEQGDYREDRLPRDDDYLFFPMGVSHSCGTGLVTWTKPDKPLSDRGMHTWWADYVIPEAGVRYRSMHMNRHTLGTNLSDAGQGLETIQDWLGHADPSTTKVYVHNSRERLHRGRAALDDFRKAQGQG